MSQSYIQHSADLILKLYELRRDPALREARHWFATQFRPANAGDMVALFMSGAAANGCKHFTRKFRWRIKFSISQSRNLMCQSTN